MKYFLTLFITALISLSANETTAKPKTQTMDKAVQKIIEKEQKFAKEQKFYQGNEYDLKSQEVDSSSLENIELLKPQDDFDMDDVY